MSGRGIFITFEGIEGSGKSTQFGLLAEALGKRDLPLVVLREPGGTPIGDQVRGILLAPELAEMTAEAEALLYAASRAQLVREMIEPALAEDRIVLCDRFLDSSIAYQGYGRGLPEDFVLAINKSAQEIRPDVTFLLDIDARVGLSRATTAGADRMEQLELSFHERVRAGYLELARRDPGRFRVLDGVLPIDDLGKRILVEVESRLPAGGR